MSSKFSFRVSIIVLSVILLAVTGFGSVISVISVIDDIEPEIKDRVARISQLIGDVDIKRTDSDEVEKAVMNLPVVQGDTIVTGPGSRFEIQFSSRKYLRVSENSQITITTLQDNGIAISVLQGIAAVRTIDFDKDSEFFELDAPKTTVAVQRSGHYVVDAGENGELVRVTVTEKGEARVYSDTSGFTLRDGRSAQLFLSGTRPGEWDMADSSQFEDDFFAWSRDRDKTIATNLKNAHYDKYYDRDIYGAEDLNQNGEWVYTATYGYVWRPYANATSRYADWSPYRYGHWRWVSPYGWTWVNDEPWGWATYHHGRWIWDNGYWYWSPYGYYRQRRSWWSPALVVVSVYNDNVCWYPLGYRHRYNNYNRSHRRNGRNYNHGKNNDGPVATNPTPTPIPSSSPVPRGPINRRGGNGRFPVDVPPTAVVAVKLDEFGLRRGQNGRMPSQEVSRAVLSKSSDETPPILPTYEEVNRKMTTEIKSNRSTFPRPQTVQTGAAPRKIDTPLDAELQKNRIYGNRPPLQTTPDIRSTPSETKRTGAVERPPIMQKNPGETPPYVPQSEPSNVDSSKQRQEYPPIRRQTPRNEPPLQREEKPRYEPPPREEKPRYEPPPRQEKPRYEPPPRQETPRYEPPQKSDPPPQKNDPPPSKSEPSKPSESAPRKNKDG